MVDYYVIKYIMSIPLDSYIALIKYINNAYI